MKFSNIPRSLVLFIALAPYTTILVFLIILLGFAEHPVSTTIASAPTAIHIALAIWFFGTQYFLMTYIRKTANLTKKEEAQWSRRLYSFPLIGTPLFCIELLRPE